MKLKLGWVRVTDMDKFGFIDKTESIIIQSQWKDASNFVDGLAPVLTDNNKYGYIDRTGKMFIEPLPKVFCRPAIILLNIVLIFKMEISRPKALPIW